MVELHQELDVNREARTAIARLGIQRQPGQGVVALHHVPGDVISIKSLQFSTECKRNITLPQDIRGDLRIQRMDFGRIVDLLLLLLKKNVVGILLDGVVVQVEGALEEGGTGARQMRARRPEPSRHVARRRRRDVVAQSQWLLQ